MRINSATISVKKEENGLSLFDIVIFPTGENGIVIAEREKENSVIELFIVHFTPSRFAFINRWKIRFIKLKCWIHVILTEKA